MGKYCLCSTIDFFLANSLLASLFSFTCPANFCSVLQEEGSKHFIPCQITSPAPAFTTDLHPTCNPPCHPRPGLASIPPPPPFLCPLCSQVLSLPAPSACAGPKKQHQAVMPVFGPLLQNHKPSNKKLMLRAKCTQW